MIFNPWESSENEINLQEKSIAISKLSDMQKELKKRREDSQVNHSPQKNTFESSLTKPISPQSAESSISPIVYNSIILFLLIVLQNLSCPSVVGYVFQTFLSNLNLCQLMIFEKHVYLD